MRAVVQRVRRATVSVDGEIHGQIGPGMLLFVGVAGGDGPGDVEYIAGKTRDLRIFPDADGRMNRSVAESGGSVLVVSQFTLQGDCRKGRRPSFDLAAPGPVARALYDDVVRALKESGLEVRTGVFQAHMDVELVNDGPVTLLLDSRKEF
ncbi:MAG: D-tyrosyl-tRNA(Tyr) deacylase [Acidobacteria bacterium]|jgi:D-tyrosyl-tRNA(Tyr) deacylase|nr:D-tyrosyl-tRNA(Tyr) deacylase [Acidobacteriota bacterium]